MSDSTRDDRPRRAAVTLPFRLTSSRKAWPLAIISCLFITAGCQRQPTSPAANAPPTPPPAKVVVSRPVERTLAETREYTGHLAAIESVAIQARVRGVLQKIHFKEKEGAEVQAGDLLYEIDPSEYQAAVNEQTSEVARLEHEVSLAESDARRSQDLFARNALAKEELESRQTSLLVRRSQLDKARASLKLAELNLEYTKIHSPISGRIGRTLVTEGNLVGYNEPTMLTTVVKMDKVYVFFEIPERDMLRLEEASRQAETPPSTIVTWQAPIAVGLETEEGQPHKGVADFRDNQVESETGTVLVRATLDNAERKLVPGLFARVQMEIGQPQNRLMVPQTAMGADQQGRFVLVLDDDNKVHKRLVRVAANFSQEGYLVISDGLNQQDRVIVSGIQKARPGTTVAPEMLTSSERLDVTSK